MAFVPLPHVHLSLSLFSSLPILQVVAATRSPERAPGTAVPPASGPRAEPLPAAAPSVTRTHAQLPEDPFTNGCFLGASQNNNRTWSTDLSQNLSLFGISTLPLKKGFSQQNQASSLALHNKAKPVPETERK